MAYGAYMEQEIPMHPAFISKEDCMCNACLGLTGGKTATFIKTGRPSSRRLLSMGREHVRMPVSSYAPQNAIRMSSKELQMLEAAEAAEDAKVAKGLAAQILQPGANL